MATTMVPPTTSNKPPSDGLRFVSVQAQLLPDEIVGGRQLLSLRKQVLAGLIAVVISLIGWYGASKWQTMSANSTLHRAQHERVKLQAEQNQFAPLVQTQNQIATIKTQLAQMMTGDVPWKNVLITLRAKAPAGVGIDSVDGTVASGAAAGSSALSSSAVLNESGKPAIGQLTVSGTAPDKRTVAAYADNLATVAGLTAPLISNVTAEETGVKFTITAVITAEALGGRYATTSAGATGGH
jgi:Tfp pilus assembly protein PilN